MPGRSLTADTSPQRLQRAAHESLLSANPDLTIHDTAFSSTPLGWAEHFQHDDLAALIRAHQDRGSQV